MARIRISNNHNKYMSIYTDNRHVFANIVIKFRTLDRLENELMLPATYYYVFGNTVIYNCY